MLPLDLPHEKQTKGTGSAGVLRPMGYSPSQQSLLRQLFGVSGLAVHKWAEGEALPNSAQMPHIASVL